MKKKPSVVMTKKDKNPSGGLSAAGRAKYNAATGAAGTIVIWEYS